MKKNKAYEEYSQPIKSDTDKLLKELISEVKANDDSELIKALIQAVKTLGEQKPPTIEPPNVNISLDVERIIRAIPKPEKQEAPKVQVNPEINLPESKPVPYRFEIQRNGANLMTGINAYPLEK